MFIAAITKLNKNKKIYTQAIKIINANYKLLS